MKCPRVYPFVCSYIGNDFKLIYRTNEDNLDKLDHSEMECPKCEYHFNYWHEPREKILKLLGKDYL